MNRETLARWALRPYPSKTEPGQAPEVLGTLMDAGDELSVWAFVHELCSVALRGTMLRAQEKHGRPLQDVAARSIGYAALVMCSWIVTGELLGAWSLSSRSLFATDLSAVVLLVALGLGHSAVIVAGLTLLWIWNDDLGRRIDLVWTVGLILAGAAVFLAQALGAGRVRRALGVAVFVTVIAGESHAAFDVVALAGPGATGWYLVAGVGVLALAFNPALTLGCGLMLGAVGALEILWHQTSGLAGPGLLFLVTTPVALALVLTAKHAIPGRAQT